MEQILERQPSIEEIAHALDIPEYKINDVLKISSKYVSMDAPVVPDDDLKFVDTFVPDDAPNTDSSLIQESLFSEIQRTLSTLSDKEKEIVNLYYGIGQSHELTLEEIGAKFDLTRERVRQIKERAIRRLKQNSKNTNLKQYL